MKLLKALVRRPSPQHQNGLLTHLTRSETDPDLALAQWEDYCDILRDHAEVIEVEPAPEYADSVYIEDTAFVYGNTAVMTKLRYPSRQPEHAAVEETLKGLGLEIKRLADWSYLEGGDILKFDDTIWVGLSTRSDLEGVQWLEKALADYAPTVIPVPVQHALHLKSAITALPDGTFLAHPKYAPPESYFPGYRRAPEFEGSQVVLLGDNKVLLSASAPETADMLKADGFDVYTTPMTEFEKTEGCVTCLSIRIRQ
ncbi:dimethylarginine dimethylaminohydrolase family protein [Flaviflexus equikiangi]|uniref:N(G),N(G)-dimethylarginine dimethylaminohydrolase n=1 Tax=Flaviflexus equikiangi TaxID=2758573 RepID=A0ABS2TLE3_9ACTO|nr:arginine deiminase family protein [Flaviflexus equikiangi]MBM9434114.1 N(G),N(G)-dimethylarginine dimethylaminohydrolase [Flaviflexus equikiangi]